MRCPSPVLPAMSQWLSRARQEADLENHFLTGAARCQKVSRKVVPRRRATFLGLLFVVVAFAVQAAQADDPRSETIAVSVVDEDGKPVAGATVRVFERDGNGAPVVTDAAGVCRIPRPIRDNRYWVNLTATNASGASQGYFEWHFRDPEAAGKPLRIALKPARECRVVVTNGTGAVVSGALVVVVERGGHDVAHGRTDNAGAIKLRFPADDSVDAVFALKSGLGFDNWSVRVDDLGTERREFPAELSLILDGAETIHIRTVDSAGKPVPGVAVFTPLVQKRDRSAQHFNKCRLADVLTDDRGVATIDWLPRDKQLRSVFYIQSSEYFQPQREARNTGQAYTNGEATITLLQRTRISGRVTGIDGQPAAGIVVWAGGNDRSGLRCQEVARTGADGRYVMFVPPAHAYLVGIVDDDWAAQSLKGIFVDEAKPVDELDLKLTHGTVIRGKVTTGEDASPAVRKPIFLAETGDPVFQPGVAKGFPVGMHRTATTDAEGRYQFRVGPGTYQVDPELRVATARQQQELTITDERVVVRDFYLPPAKEDAKLASAILRGEVLGPDGKPVHGAKILGCYAAYVRTQPRGNSEIKSVSDDSGEFKIERLQAPMWLFAWSSEGALGGSFRVEADQELAKLKLAPTAQAVGRLMDGEAPIAGENVNLSVAIATINRAGRTARTLFQIGSATTAADGRFVLSGLIVGADYTIGIGSTPDLGIRGERGGLNRLLVERSGTISLGYSDAPRMRTEMTDEGVTWRHIDVTAQIANRFATHTDLATRISVAVADAKNADRRVLLLLGDPDSPPVQTVFRVLERLEEVDDFAAFRRQLRARRGGGREPVDEFTTTMAGFECVYVTVNDKEAAAYLARAYRLDITKPALPVLVVLAEDGAVDEQKSFAPSSDSPQVDRAAVREFVKRHAPPIRDAEELFRDAARRARAEGKHVLLQQSGHNSYPARLLTRFIEQHRKLLERDYVYLNIDPLRTTNGDVVIAQYRKAGDSLPWLAILNADGVKLADSDSPAGNIGFPSEPDEIDYFIEQMLKPTSQHLTNEDRERLRSALRERDAIRPLPH